MSAGRDEQTLNDLGYIILGAEQILQYYDHISLPERFRYSPGPKGSGSNSSKAAEDPELALPFLTALIRHHGASVPFENLTLHYDPSHVVSLHHDVLFDKIVAKSSDDGKSCNRGGYCMENNGFFLCILRSLGFDVYPTGARICKQYEDPSAPPHFQGWLHQVNLVRIGGTTYMTDVGIGPAMPVSPMPLTSNSSTPVVNYGKTRVKLCQGNIMDNTCKSSANDKVWVYSVQFDAEKNSPWTTVSCFAEVEWIQYDFEIINTYAYSSRTFWMVSSVICFKLVLDESSNVIGSVSLNSATFKRRVRGTAETLECKTEHERWDAFERFFGIRLTRNERRGIRNLPSALPGAGLLPSV